MQILGICSNSIILYSCFNFDKNLAPVSKDDPDDPKLIQGSDDVHLTRTQRVPTRNHTRNH